MQVHVVIIASVRQLIHHIKFDGVYGVLEGSCKSVEGQSDPLGARSTSKQRLGAARRKLGVCTMRRG
jgi:hypothetical protein